MNQHISLFALLCVTSTFAGCDASRAAPSDKASVAQAVSATPSAVPAAQAPVARLVFMDKQEACDCTRARVTKGWEALQAALVDAPAPSVERLYVDTQPDQVRAYSEMRPMVAVPALYFLSESGALVEQLQGEFTTAQIKAVLGTRQ